jgi:hypothetical protein
MCSSMVLRSKWINFLVDIKWIHWSLWCSCQPLRKFLCFDEVRKPKAWNYNPLVSSVLYFASTQGNMHPMMGDVILGEKFPRSILFDISWLIALQRAWGVFIVTSRNTSYLPKWASRLVVVWNRRGMSSQLNLEKVRRERKLEEMSDLQIWGSSLFLAPKWLVCRERGFSSSTYSVWPIRKDLVVMSQWAHITMNWECP